MDRDPDNATQAGEFGDSWPAGPPLVSPEPAPLAGAPHDRAWVMPEMRAGADPPGFGADVAAIGSSPSTTGGAPDPGGPAARAPDSADRPAAPRLPVPLAPMTLSDLLDGAWAILKARPRTVLGTTAAIMVPVQLVVAWLERGNATTDLNYLFDGSSPATTSSASTGWVSIGLVLSMLSYFFLGGALSRLVTSWYAGGDLSVTDVVKATLRKTHIWVAAFLLLLIPKVLAAVLLVVPLAFVIPMFMLTAPAIMVEDLGPIAGAMRSFKLVGRRYFWCFYVWGLTWLLEATVGFMLGLIPNLLATFVPQLASALLAAAFGVFAKLVTAPFVVGVSVLLYLDLRVRTEGLDLELEAADAFAGVA